MKLQRQALWILIITFIVVLAWTGIHFDRLYTESTISSTLQVQIAPITPAFDTATIATLRTRTTIQPLYTVVGSTSAAPQIAAPSSGVPQVPPSFQASSSANSTVLLPSLTFPIGTNGGLLK